MQVIKDDASLAEAIRLLENRRISQEDSLKEHWELTLTNLNPITLLKDGIKDTFSSPDFKSTLLKGAIGLATGFFTKKLIVGSSHSAIKAIIGTIAQTGATSLAFQNTEDIKSKGVSFLSNMLKKIKIEK